MKQLLILAACCLGLITYAQNERIEDLTVQLAYQEADSAKVDLSLELIKELYAREAYQKALRYINQTTKLCEKLSYAEGLAKSTYYRGLIYSKQNDYINAIDNFEKSRFYFSQIKDTLGIAKVNNSLGLIQIQRGNYALGLKNALSAIAVFENEDLYQDLSIAYNNLADAYGKTNQIEKALAFNTKALETRKKINDSEGVILSTKNIADLYAQKKEHRKAIDYYTETLKLMTPNTAPALRGEILTKLGGEYLNFKEFKKAADLLVKGLKQNRAIDNKEGVVQALNAIGNLNLQKRKVRLAQTQLNEAYNIATKIDDKPALLENYRLHIALDSTRGYFQNAFFWQNKYYDLREELQKATPPPVPSDLQTIDLNNSDDANAEVVQIKKGTPPANQKTGILFNYGAMALGLSLLALTIFHYTKSKNYRRTIATQKGRIEQFQTNKKDILEQNRHLEEVNQVKDKLFSIVSHDLKDSISSIKAFLDLLKEDSISKDEFRALIPELSENANNASSLLFNLLNWSKSQMQSLEPKPELFNIQEVFHTKMALVEQKVEDKRIVLIDESQRDFIYADQSMVEIVVQNLITNAVKFSRTGDVITISNYDINGKARICIEDTGVGISRENMDKLFNANKTFTTIGTKNEKGTGLGLTIAKDLIELNAGKIWVESTVNVGSKFFIELPKVAPKV